MKRLVLHIGTHKTGTTSIQYTLARSERALADQGVIYPAHYANANNPGHHFLALGTGRERYKALIETIDKAPQGTVILSTELLSTVPAERVGELVSRYDTNAICLLRRQDEYLESMYRELCKSSFCAQTPDSFVNSVLADEPLLIFSDFKRIELRAPLPADYERLLAGYADLLGEDRVIGIPYDDPAFGDDALNRFCRAAGIVVEPIGGGPRNVSFSPEVVELRRRLDASLEEQEKRTLRPLFWKLNDTIASEQKGQSILGTDQRQRILTHYAASNARLRKRFIPRAAVDWLTAPESTARSVTATQAVPLDVSRAIDLTARLFQRTDAGQPSARTHVGSKPAPPPRKSRAERKTETSGQINLIGLNFANINQLLDDPERLQTYMDAMDECALNAIRIPFYWRHLIAYQADGTARVDDRLASYYRSFVAKLPEHVKITGVVVNCHPEPARMAYLGQPGFAERYAEYVRLLVETFDFIDDIELWNEPNASDFYVSVKGEDGLHRPWNGSEFVDMVVRPGVESLRRAGFAGRICGVTFAENGLVGHVKRTRPAFANTMRDYADEFAAEFSDNQGHGAFYFQPDFARDVMQALKSHYPTAQDLPFEAFGIHPYPYFGPAPDGFAAHSWHLTQDFLSLLEDTGYSGVPVWITEVGARSLDLSKGYDFDAMAQADFVDDFMTHAAGEASIEKLFWYKYRDEVWDLKQEKSFGLVDHEGRKKPAYYSFRSRALDCLPPQSIRVLQDDFGSGAVMQAASVDKSFWKIEKTEPFAYAIPAHTGTAEGAALLVSPGRAVGSVLRLETSRHLAADEAQRLKAALRFRPKATGPGKPEMTLGLQITNLANPETGLFLSIRINGVSGVAAFAFGTTRTARTPVAEVGLADLSQFTEVTLETRKGRVWLSCVDGDGSVLTEIDLCAATQAFLGRRLRGAIEVSRTKGPIHFIELSRFGLGRQVMIDDDRTIGSKIRSMVDGGAGG